MTEPDLKTKGTVTDARGRVIVVEKLNALQYYLLARVMGEDASNPTIRDMAMIAACVRRVDTIDLTFPRQDSDIRFALQVLDFDGIAAAGEGLKSLNNENIEEVAKN
jgi:hypothetical protein